MNTEILQEDVQYFIQEHLNDDINTLILKGSPFANIDIKILANQIEAKKKCEYKLPTWFTTKNIIYPPKLSIEQTSSEITAQYKSQLFSREKLIDATGGFGVDCYYFSKQFKEVHHCEIQEDLSNIVHHNNLQLQINNCTTHAVNGIDFIINNPNLYDVIYIDPSRRNDSKGKVFMLEDCLPNVPEHLNELLKKGKIILVKTSPILDISNGLQSLQLITEIHIVAVNNEVKELLWIIDSEIHNDLTIKTINIKNDHTVEQLNFNYQQLQQAIATYAEPQQFIYEPNAAILKSGAFALLSELLKIDKLAIHSHLYTSKHLIDFPGRSFKIEKVYPYQKKQLKKTFKNTKANITTRNFPESVAVIRKQLGIHDGGDVYLFFTTDLNQKKIVIVASKI
ncbi:class I SAM-dependent methyltransferase [Zhouia sp. PK063]|uniref:THUMP-like domain-containing protein n=1 Tax=Zhouia sp. PK063 TaxID=3373602 RepID=UPI0037BCF6D0